jgi:hypothetical protein
MIRGNGDVGESVQPTRRLVARMSGLLITATACGGLGSVIAMAQGVPAGPPAPPANPSKNVVFIHDGNGGGDVPGDVVNTIANELAKVGYIVRSPDHERDVVGGQGVDYFFDQDLPFAQHVAAVANFELTAAYTAAKLTVPPTLVPRRQVAKNLPGYLGLWLFPKPTPKT